MANADKSPDEVVIMYDSLTVRNILDALENAAVGAGQATATALEWQAQLDPAQTDALSMCQFHKRKTVKRHRLAYGFDNPRTLRYHYAAQYSRTKRVGLSLHSALCTSLGRSNRYIMPCYTQSKKRLSSCARIRLALCKAFR